MKVTDSFPRSIAVMLRESELAIQRDYIQEKLLAALPDSDVIFAASPAELTDVVQHIEALITPTDPWVDEVAELAPNLKWIHFLSAGVDRIWDFNFFERKDYLLTKSSGVHAIPMAEYAIAGLLYFLKGFHIFHGQQRNREWQRHWLEEATGKTVAILGLGAIGTEIAKRCKQMGMTVIGMATSERVVENVDRVCTPPEVNGLLQVADFVIVCLPLTPDTRNLLDEASLKAMKPGAYLVDISRGTIVDQNALVKLLQEGHIAGAVLDVFETEPLPPESPLWELENVLITPHVSGTTPRYMERAIDIFLQNREALLANGSLTTPVDIRTRY